MKLQEPVFAGGLMAALGLVLGAAAPLVHTQGYHAVHLTDYHAGPADTFPRTFATSVEYDGKLFFTGGSQVLMFDGENPIQSVADFFFTDSLVMYNGELYAVAWTSEYGRKLYRIEPIPDPRPQRS